MDRSGPMSTGDEGRPQRPRSRRSCGRLPAFGVLLLMCLPCHAVGAEPAKGNLPRVEAAFLRNFAHYITWPASAFADDRSPWRICVLGKDPFGDALEKTFEGRVEQGRAFEFIRTESPADLAPCHMVYVAQRTSESRRAVLAELAKRPVLTVGDASGFLQEGGIIRFEVTDHVEFGINLDQARSVSLKVQTKVLEVAHEVVENGVVRRRR